MKKLLFIIVALSLASCGDKHEVGEYFYVGHGNVYHIDKTCNGGSKDKANGKILVNAHDTYKNAIQYANDNQWRIRLSSQSIYFCSKCIDSKQMRQIEDSIAKYQKE